jgi:hypothetical protein
MLVDDDRRFPGQAIARRDHCLGERQDLAPVERLGGAGGHEGRQVDVGIPSRHNIADDAVQRAFAQCIAIDTAADEPERFDRIGVRDRDGRSLLQPEPAPGRFRERRLVRGDEVADDLVERRDDFTIAGLQPHAIVRDEPF